MTRNVKISLGLIVMALVVVLVAALAARGGGEDTDTAVENPPADRDRSEMLVPPDAQRLSTAPDGKVTLVEFLDFECEACRAAYPTIEAMREQYGDQITFVVRYLPLHANSMAASQAAEAAADQGRFEDMYHRLFETQPEWGERQDSQEDVFFGFAEEMGLDMERFREVYDAPETIARIQRSANDAMTLGAKGTPTFFLNGELLEISTFSELLQRVDDAING